MFDWLQRRGPIVALTMLLCISVSGCGGGGGGRSNAPPARGANPPQGPAATVVATSAYRTGAPYAGALQRCTYAGEATEACPLSTLPFLGMQTDTVTIEQVLSRTLVSHRWMGDNFGGALARLPADLLPLFRSVTAVVIASDVRPSFYDPDTGAIYLDPEFLWLRVSERDQVPDTPDFRSEFGRDLGFQMPWRYVRDGQRLTVYLNPDGSRDPDQIIEILGYLLYHELAHATDFMPPADLSGLSNTQTARSAILSGRRLSSLLTASYPLNSTLLKDLAAVSFLGATSTAAQRTLAPDDLVVEFSNDGATQYYAYSTRYEDFATQFETAMMKWHFGYDKDTAIVHPPASGNADDAVLAWGERGRIGAQHVMSRTLAVGQRLYPGELRAFEAFLADQPLPRTLTRGTTWRDSLSDQTTAGAAAAPAARPSRRVADYVLERVRIR